MKRIKKLISTIVASTFLFGLAAPMAYAKTSDDAVNRLKALGTVTGYADGDMKLDQNITRAEFAAIAVRALGLENAAKLSKGNTKFSDVNSTHWAAGYINLAIDRGVITGYPDKTFKPEQNVSNAEAIAMVVRTLGYEQALEGGTWPTKYISKAAYLDLLDNVAIDDYNAKATRGDVFMVLDEALETKIWKLIETKGSEQTWGEGKTLMEEKLKVAEVEDLVVDTVTTQLGISNDEVKLLGQFDDDAALETKTFDLASGLNAFPFYGLKVKAYIKTDEDKVVTLAVDEDDCFTDIVKAIAADGAEFKLTFKDHDKEITNSATLYDYSATTKAVNATTVLPGDKVTVVMDGGKIVKVIKLDLTGDVGIVDEVKNNKIYFNDDAGNASDLDLDSSDMDNIQIYRDGKPATLADIKAGDTVSYLGDKDKCTIFVSSTEVTGTLKSVAALADTDVLKLTIDDKVVITEQDSTFSTNGGDTYKAVTQDALGEDLVGKKVTVKVNANGLGTFVIGDEKGSTNSIKAIVRNVTYDDNVGSNSDDVVKYIKVTKLDGTETVYTIDNDDYEIQTAGSVKGKAILNLDDHKVTVVGDQVVQAGDFVYLTLDSNGKVTNIDTPADKNDDVVNFATATSITVNEDRDIVVVDSNKTYIVTADTKVFDVDAEGSIAGTYSELSKTTWNAIEDDVAIAYNVTTAPNGLKDSVKVWADGSEIIAVFVTKAVTGGGNDDLWGVTFGNKVAIGSGDYSANVWVNGTRKDINLDDSVEDSFPKNEVVVYNTNGDGEIDEIAAAPAFAVAKIVTGTEKTNGNLIIKYDGGQFVAVDADVKFFDINSGTMETADSVGKGDTILVYDILNEDNEVSTPGDGIVDVVVIQ